jgi:hypothetical protein
MDNGDWTPVPDSDLRLPVIPGSHSITLLLKPPDAGLLVGLSVAPVMEQAAGSACRKTL